MKNHANRRSVSSKAFAAVLALVLVLVLGCALGGTVAWLVAESGPATNTFTYGDININLEETTGSSYKIIPGVDIAKDPKVTVEADSEACWLFVKVEEVGTFVEVTYSAANGWTQGDGTKIPKNVYYREVSAADAKKGVSYYVLAGDTDHPNGVVKVSDRLTKEDIQDITIKPTLTFTAYAVQKDGIADAATAWSKIS